LTTHSQANDNTNNDFLPVRKTKYNLGLGKNQPVGNETIITTVQDKARDNLHANDGSTTTTTSARKLVAQNELGEMMLPAVSDEEHFASNPISGAYTSRDTPSTSRVASTTSSSNRNSSSSTSTTPNPAPVVCYTDIDLSIPESVYSLDGNVDLVWDLLRYEAYQESLREPLLVSFLYSTILNHPTLESSLAFLLANRLQSPAMMISTQLQSLILEALEQSPDFRRAVRADMMAVRDRDPACNTLPDVFLYFKGFHALQAHRTAHYLWRNGRHILASFLQSQVSQVFQIDIHPNATLGSGIMLDHGTGIVMGETVSLGHNCSVLHHVTLGGSGKKGIVRHPQISNGVLLGAGATALGPVKIGEGSQVGAGTLVINDLPAHCVAVGGTYRNALSLCFM
jgi:serine O-acetyltransferase